jgi:hypothetical protein
MTHLAEGNAIYWLIKMVYQNDRGFSILCALIANGRGKTAPSAAIFAL